MIVPYRSLSAVFLLGVSSLCVSIVSTWSQSLTEKKEEWYERIFNHLTLPQQGRLDQIWWGITPLNEVQRADLLKRPELTLPEVRLLLISYPYTSKEEIDLVATQLLEKTNKSLTEEERAEFYYFPHQFYAFDAPLNPSPESPKTPFDFLPRQEFRPDHARLLLILNSGHMNLSIARVAVLSSSIKSWKGARALINKLSVLSHQCTGGGNACSPLDPKDLYYLGMLALKQVEKNKAEEENNNGSSSSLSTPPASPAPSAPLAPPPELPARSVSISDTREDSPKELSLEMSPTKDRQKSPQDREVAIPNNKERKPVPDKILDTVSPILPIPEREPLDPLFPLYMGAAEGVRKSVSALYGNYTERTGFAGFMQTGMYGKNIEKERGKPGAAFLTMGAHVAWGRIIAQQENIYYLFENNLSEPSKNHTYKTLAGIQAGLNVIESETRFGTTLAGVSFSYAQSEMSLETLLGSSSSYRPIGHLSLKAFAGTFHVTHFIYQRFYADLGIMGTGYWGETKDASNLRLQAPLQGRGWLVSAELGWRIPLTPVATFLPQIQLCHLEGTLDSLTKNDFAKIPHHVVFKDITQTWLRVGGLVSSVLPLTKEIRLLPYFALDYLRNLSGSPLWTIDHQSFSLPSSATQRHRTQIGAGIGIEIREHFNFFAYGRYQRSLGAGQGEVADMFSGGFGFHYAF